MNGRCASNGILQDHACCFTPCRNENVFFFAPTTNQSVIDLTLLIRAGRAQRSKFCRAKPRVPASSAPNVGSNISHYLSATAGQNRMRQLYKRNATARAHHQTYEPFGSLLQASRLSSSHTTISSSGLHRQAAQLPIFRAAPVQLQGVSGLAETAANSPSGTNGRSCCVAHQGNGRRGPGALQVILPRCNCFEVK